MFRKNILSAYCIEQHAVPISEHPDQSTFELFYSIAQVFLCRYIFGRSRLYSNYYRKCLHGFIVSSSILSILQDDCSFYELTQLLYRYIMKESGNAYVVIIIDRITFTNTENLYQNFTDVI